MKLCNLDVLQKLTATLLNAPSYNTVPVCLLKRQIRITREHGPFGR